MTGIWIYCLNNDYIFYLDYINRDELFNDLDERHLDADMEAIGANEKLGMEVRVAVVVNKLDRRPHRFF